MSTMIFAPGQAGISYGDASALLDALESSGSEMHALYVARSGRKAFECYWSPYDAKQIHGSQSLTKTATGIALGAAIHEGVLRLDDRLIDIFPEYAHHAQGRAYWDELQVRHIATMAAGMEAQPPVTVSDWQERFFTMEILHPPGGAFYYNSIACSMVGACIYKRTGLGLRDYLADRVLCKIGIDANHLGWHKHPDGLENGSGGLISTARENALLMELYRRGGIWEGERLLDANWVTFALQIQNPHAPGENQYGGMLWVWKRCFAADGAMGQWALYYPEQDLIFSINQTISSSTADCAVRTAIEHFVDCLKPSPVLWTEADTASFKERLCALKLDPALRRDNPKARINFDKCHLRIVGGKAQFYADDLCIFNPAYSASIEEYGFSLDGDVLTLQVRFGGENRTYPVRMDGRRVPYIGPIVNGNPAHTLCATGSFEDERTLEIEVRWLESCRVHCVRIRLEEDGSATIVTSRKPVGGFDVPDMIAKAVRVNQGE